MKWLLLLPLLHLSAFAKQEQGYKLDGDSHLATEEWHLFGRIGNVVKIGSVSENPVNTSSANNDFKHATFREWHIYKDDLISFEYPKDSQVRIKKIKGDEVGALIANKVQPSKLGYHEYQILVNNKVEMTLDYTKVEGFGTYSYYHSPYVMEHEQFRIVGKALAKYHFWIGGVLSDVQVSNDKELVKCLVTEDPSLKNTRLSSLDRERIAASIKLNSSSGKTKEEWINLVNKRANWKGLCSFLYKGMVYQEIVHLLGEPSIEVSTRKKIWLRKGNNYPLRLELHFDLDNKLLSLPHFGVESDYSKPIIGKPAWIKNITSRGRYLLNLPLKKIFGEPIRLKSKVESAYSPLFERHTSPEIKLSDDNKKQIQESLLQLMASPKISLRTQSTYLASRLIKKWRLDPAPFAKLIIKNKIVGVSAAKILSRFDPKIFKGWVTAELEKLYVKTWTRKFT